MSSKNISLGISCSEQHYLLGGWHRSWLNHPGHGGYERVCFLRRIQRQWLVMKRGKYIHVVYYPCFTYSLITSEIFSRASHFSMTCTIKSIHTMQPMGNTVSPLYPKESGNIECSQTSSLQPRGLWSLSLRRWRFWYPLRPARPQHRPPRCGALDSWTARLSWLPQSSCALLTSSVMSILEGGSMRPVQHAYQGAIEWFWLLSYHNITLGSLDGGISPLFFV